MEVRAGADLLERAKSSDDATFRSKFVAVPGYLMQWTDAVGGLRGKRILDFGCGDGTTACAVATTCEPLSVEGVDINQDHQSCSRIMRKQLQIDMLPKNLSFRTLRPGQQLPEARYDVVYSWSVFEHVDREIFDGVVRSIRTSLIEGGVFFVQIAPLYYSAEGSHLARYGIRSWEHLTLQLNTLRSRVLENAAFGEVGRRADWDCFETLNKITADELIEGIRKQGFTLLRRYQTNNSQEPPVALQAVFCRDVLRTEQIVALFQKAPIPGE